MPDFIEGKKEKIVILTLDELCEILCASRAKAMNVDEEVVDSYVEAFKKDFMPVADFIWHEQQLRNVTEKKPELKIIT